DREAAFRRSHRIRTVPLRRSDRDHPRTPRHVLSRRGCPPGLLHREPGQRLLPCHHRPETQQGTHRLRRMGELMGSHRKDKCKKSKHKARKRSKDAGGDACEVTKDRVRAHFLDGNTGPWAKDLAAQDAQTARSAQSEHNADHAEDAAASAKGSTATITPTRRGPDYSVPSSIDIVADPVLHALSTRRSISKVDPETPNDSDLLEIIRSISSVADHKSLRPWRFLIIRGDDRLRLGEALDEAAGVVRKPGETNTKPLRAELLLAL